MLRIHRGRTWRCNPLRVRFGHNDLQQGVELGEAVLRRVLFPSCQLERHNECDAGGPLAGLRVGPDTDGPCILELTFGDGHKISEVAFEVRVKIALVILQRQSANRHHQLPLAPQVRSSTDIPVAEEDHAISVPGELMLESLRMLVLDFLLLGVWHLLPMALDLLLMALQLLLRALNLQVVACQPMMLVAWPPMMVMMCASDKMRHHPRSRGEDPSSPRQLLALQLLVWYRRGLFPSH